MVSVVIHANPGLKNQRDCAAALKKGFAQFDINAEIRTNRQVNSTPETINVIQGPWWLFNEFLGKPHVLWLDRTFYGCPVNNVSLGWLHADGSRDFGNCDKPAKGDLPELKPEKKKKRCAIVFGDYGRDPAEEYKYARRTFDSVWFRPHPKDPENYIGLPLRGSLSGLWQIGDVAVGHKSTVLVDAAINGLSVHSTWEHHVCHFTDREGWLRQLSWKQWSLEELEAGDFWEHLS